MSEIVIDRWECRPLRARRDKWMLVYGRRKTGKTWLLRRCTRWSLYATVSHSGECVLDDGGSTSMVSLEECMDRVARALTRGDRVVLDEFQRLPRVYWDLLSSMYWKSEGVLIACGSSMGIAGRVLGRGSLLRGIFQAFHVDIASMWDTIASLDSAGLSAGEAVLWAPIARDPWILAHVSPSGEPWAALARLAPRLAPAARGLVREIFAGEDREDARTYEAVLQLLAEGVWSASGIAQRLYAARLISSPRPGQATGILKLLQSIGLVEGVPLWRTRRARVYYRHRSPATSLLYRAYQLLGADSSPGPEDIASWYGLEAQFSIGELLAESHGLRRAYSVTPRGDDIDVVLLDWRGRPVWGYEVKLGPMSRYEARRAVERIRRMGIPRAGLVSVSERPPEVGDDSLGPEELLGMSMRLRWAHYRR